MKTRQLFHRAIDTFDRCVHAVDDDRWGAPTPCAEWDVRALVRHVVSETAWIPPLLAGQTIEEVGDQLDGDLLGDDPQAAWTRAAQDARRSADGGGDLQATVHLSSGDTSAEQYLAEVTVDITVHSWDLARAVGADDEIAPELVEFVHTTLAPRIQQWRAAGLLAEPLAVAPDADPQTRLLALVGRDPRWRPASVGTTSSA